MTRKALQRARPADTDAWAVTNDREAGQALGSLLGHLRLRNLSFLDPDRMDNLLKAHT
jgi:hypothetical protein